jgi:hypothetical protein
MNPCKRKATSQLSSNPNTAKARKRNENISKDPIRHKVEKAKAADQGAITYAKKKLVKSDEYQAASESEKEGLVRKSANEVILKRLVISWLY